LFAAFGYHFVVSLLRLVLWGDRRFPRIRPCDCRSAEWGFDMYKHSLLATVCLAALCIAGTHEHAHGATCYGDPNCSLGTEPYTGGGTNQIYGGGSSVGAVYWRQISDCYAEAADLMAKGPSYYVDETLVDFGGRKPQNCQTTEINPDTTTWYISTGSGIGILAQFSHDSTDTFGPVNVADGDQFFPEMIYSLSSIGLQASDVAAYDNGDNSYCQGSDCIDIAAPGVLECAGEQGGIYPNPAQCYGPLIQFPLSVDPLAMVYANNGTYEKTYDEGTGKEIDYHFNVQGGTKSGGLRLSVASLCGIWNGEITDWNDPALTADNGGVSLEDPDDPTSPSHWSVPLMPVARSDASGSTLTLTRHLAQVCSGYGPNAYKHAAATMQGAGVSGSAMTQVPYSEGMAQAVAFTASPVGQGDQCSEAVLVQGYTDCIQQGSIGYIGSDYVLPFVSNNGTNTYGLFAAAVENHRGEFVSPSPESALIAFKEAGLPPQTNRHGQYCPNCGNLKRNNPADWNPQNLLGDPTERGGYPLVGTTNYVAYTCYASRGALANLVAEVEYVEKSPINTARNGILESSGLGVLPSTWRDAIDQTFITNSDGQGLQWSVAGRKGTTACQNTVGG